MSDDTLDGFNLTLDQYLDGYERSIDNVPDVLQRWQGMEDDLREHLADELYWMIGVQPDILAAAGDRRDEAETRLRLANERLDAFRDQFAALGLNWDDENA